MKRRSMLIAVVAVSGLMFGCAQTPTEPQHVSGQEKIKAQMAEGVTWTGGDNMTVRTQYTPDANGVMTIARIYLTRTNTYTTEAWTQSRYYRTFPVNPPMATFVFTSPQRPYNKLKVCVNYDLQIIYAVEEFFGQGQFCYYIDSNHNGTHLITQY